MSFFYDLNKKLDGIRATPETTHKQLNERDMSRAAKGIEKYGKDGMQALARAGREGKALDPVRNKFNKYDESITESNHSIRDDLAYEIEMILDGALGGNDQTDSITDDLGDIFSDIEDSGDRAAMMAYEMMVDTIDTDVRTQADAARKALKLLKNDSDSMEEGQHSQDAMKLNPDFARVGRKPGVMGKIARGVKKVADFVAPGDEDLMRDLERKSGGRRPAKEAAAPMTPKQKSFAKLAPPKDKITFADKIAGAKKEVDEMLGDVAAEAMKSALRGGQKKLDKNDNGKLDANDFELLRTGGGKKSMGEAQSVTTYTVAYKDPKKPGKSYSTQVKATSAAEAKAAFRDWDETGRFTYLGSRPDVDKVHEASADNAFTAHKRPRAETPKVGTITHGSKHDVEEIPGGRRVTRRTDAQGISVGADDDKPADGEKRSRGRPKGPEKAPERVTGGATKHKGGRKTNEGSDYGQAQQIYDDLADVRAVAKQAQRGGEFPQGFASRLESVLYAAMTLIKNQQAGGAQVSEEELDEKAVSKKQQKFMGMVHAAQKGEKPASGAVAKVAKDMGKKDAKDFASTKHKGLPEKKKPEAKDKKKEVEETSDNTPGKSSGGFKFGGGIYDSINRDLENMIAESMSINMSMNNDEHGGPTRSLTVTATDDDAMKLSQLLKSAGLGGGDEGYGGGGYKPACGCGTPDCSCGEQQMDEVSMNQPDYPTNTETSNDALQYSGGLNKPKSTGQTTVPVIASQEERQYTQEGSDYDELTDKIQWLMGAPNYLKPDEAREAAAYTPDTDSIWDGYRDDTNEDSLARMMEMAGVKKKAVDEEKTEEGNLFTKGLADDNVKVGDKIPGTNAVKKKDIDESIFAMTANLWKTYKG
jgi:hypothetical protein